MLLKLIATVILLLWQIFETYDSSNYLVSVTVRALRQLLQSFYFIYSVLVIPQKSWFSTSFQNTIVERMMVKRFPYTLLEHNRVPTNTNKKGKTSVTLSGVLAEHTKFLADQQCIYLNVTLSHICLLLSKYSSNNNELKLVLQYITSK